MKDLRGWVKVVLLLIAVGVVGFLYHFVVQPGITYFDARANMKEGKHKEALVLFESLDGFLNSEKKAEECGIAVCGEEKWNEIKNLKIGDRYLFGSYEQDNDLSNGTETIEWRILDKKGTQILVTSEYVLDCQPYDWGGLDITWEDSSLREWLNLHFIADAFSEEEQAMIPTVIVSADKNPEYNVQTDPGNPTEDQIFVLSGQEAARYFASDDDRIGVATSYASAQGIQNHTQNGHCWTWLRNPGIQQDCAANVGSNGHIYYIGEYVQRHTDGVRPALWIDLNP